MGGVREGKIMARNYRGASMGNFELERVLGELSSGIPEVVKKTMTFDGATVNDPGDYTGGTGNPADLFTVSGDVLVYVFGVCKTTLVGAGSLEVGVTGGTAAVIAQIVDATDLIVNEAYWDATPTLAEAVAPVYSAIGGGLDIIQTVGTANITAGKIDYYCYWKPLSEGATVTAA